MVNMISVQVTKRATVVGSSHFSGEFSCCQIFLPFFWDMLYTAKKRLNIAKYIKRLTYLLGIIYDK